MNRILILAVLTAVIYGMADSLKSKKIILNDGKIAVVEEGSNEPRSIGSYSLRLYSGLNPDFPYDDFLHGTVRKRDGFIEKLFASDVDKDGVDVLIVLLRSAGSGSYLSFDAFSLDGDSLKLIMSQSGLDKLSDPVNILKKNID